MQSGQPAGKFCIALLANWDRAKAGAGFGRGRILGCRQNGGCCRPPHFHSSAAGGNLITCWTKGGKVGTNNACGFGGCWLENVEKGWRLITLHTEVPSQKLSCIKEFLLERPS